MVNILVIIADEYFLGGILSFYIGRYTVIGIVFIVLMIPVLLDRKYLLVKGYKSFLLLILQDVAIYVVSIMVLKRTNLAIQAICLYDVLFLLVLGAENPSQIPKDEKLKWPQSWLDSLLLIFIIVTSLLGFYLRYKGILTRSYWVDEAISITVADNIAKTGKNLLDSGQVYKSYMLHTYLMGVIIKILGSSYFATRILSVISATYTVLINALFIRKYINIYVAFIFSLILSFSLFDLSISTQARHYALVALLYSTYSWVLFDTLMQKSFTSARVVIILGLFLCNILLSGAMAFILIAASGLMILIINPGLLIRGFQVGWKTFKSFNLPVKVGTMLTTLFLFTSLIIYEWPTLTKVGIFFAIRNNLPYYIKFLDLINPVGTVLFFFGIYSLFRQRNKTIALIISFGVLPLGILSFFNIYPTSPFERYIHFVYYLFVLVFAVAIVYSLTCVYNWMVVSKIKYPLIPVFIFWGLMVASIGKTELFSVQGRKEYPVAITTATFPPYDIAADYISLHATDGDVVVSLRAAVYEAYDIEVNFLLAPQRDSLEFQKIEKYLSLTEGSNKSAYGKDTTYLFGKDELDHVVQNNQCVYVLWDWDLGDNLDWSTMNYLKTRMDRVVLPGVSSNMLTVYKKCDENK